MTPRDLGSALLLGVPLLLLGALSGALRVLARRESLAPGRRRAYQVGWVLVLLAGVPLWLVLAAILRIW